MQVSFLKPTPFQSGACISYKPSISSRRIASAVRCQQTSDRSTEKGFVRVAIGAALAATLALGGADSALAAGIRVKGFPTNSEDELSEKYSNSSEKKARASSKRKEALSKRRAEALAKGASDTNAAAAEGQPIADPAAPVTKEAKQEAKLKDPEVIAANDEVDRANAERAAAAEKMMASIRSKASKYP